MESAALAVKKVHVLRIDPGEDVLGSIRKFLDDEGVRQAVVLGGYGTLAAHHLHWVKHNRLPAENHFEKGAGGIEILSMNGLVVEGAAHVHVALSTPDGAYGGHLEEGCVTYVLCEVFLAELEGVELTRRPARVNVEGMGEGEVPRLTFGR
jgi:predicted DNA-binding protein with PD1-like motif